MELFFTPGTVALASLIVLEETKTPFTAKPVDFARKQQMSDDYLALNPKGRVPALVTDKGILTETPALLVYLATLRPDANLLPSDPFVFAKMQELNSFLASTVHINHAHGMRGPRWASQKSSFEDMQAKVSENMAANFAMIQENYFVGPWVMGEQYTVADAYLFTVGRWLASDDVDIETFPTIATHSKIMAARPAVKAALAHR